ncbi:hypothetical protein [Capnocytophaga sp. H2931]|uniref:hypothetical protein n=1 Tax=Capnocytophaga sp. H2931 TaxID=1945657 RepID=UPI000BB16BB1|nr:hypothetical protein [Capnocytophaga sp. H2931]ATA75239.1 hypothetical protein CGC52_07330 [Capnocytophaga sp. H2931]
MAEVQVPDFRKLAREALQNMPQRIGEEARAFFVQSFVKQGFTDTSFIPWVKRKSEIVLPHKLLNQSLALKNSIRIAQSDWKKTIISAGEGLNYAAIHNEGGTITVKVTEKMRKYFWAMYKKTGNEYFKNLALTKKEQFTISIGKRQFIGNSNFLAEKLTSIIINEIKTAERNLDFK